MGTKRSDSQGEPEDLSPQARELDRQVEQELARLGLADHIVHRDRFRRRPDGEVVLVTDQERIDIAEGESYIRGRPEDTLPVLRALTAEEIKEYPEALWDAVEAAGIRTGIYPCSWEMG